MSLNFIQNPAKKLTVATVKESLAEGRVFNIYFPTKLLPKRLWSFKSGASQQKLLNVKNVLDLDPVCWHTLVIQEPVWRDDQEVKGMLGYLLRLTLAEICRKEKADTEKEAEENTTTSKKPTTKGK